MARYRDSVCKLCRREGAKLFLKGERCLSERCAIERREYPPGQHGQRRPRFSEYGLQLREKQKVRRIYGVLEKQFRSYFYRADKKKGVTGTNLLELLERRLDNTVYLLGLASSRSEARHLIRHGHFLVNGVRVNIPSYSVSVGDTIEVREKSRKLASILNAVELVAGRGEIPVWLECNAKQLKGTVKGLPTRADIGHDLNENLIVELYSK